MPPRIVIACSKAHAPIRRTPRLQEAARYVSTTVARTPTCPTPTRKPALSRLPTPNLLRSLFLTSFMSSGLLMKPSLALLEFLTKSKLALFNPDRNPILKRLLRWTIYDHFCAGENVAQVRRAVAAVKKQGYQGVVLNYAREIVLDTKAGSSEQKVGDYAAKCHGMVEEWKKGNLETLRMLSPGDTIAVKVSGAGPIAVDAMRASKPIPDAIRQALDEICEASTQQGSRVWIDAEQQALQPQLDEWTIDLMRRHNRDARPLVYNTIQAYLKGSTANAERHIALAAREGWSLGIKLVRGAYIEHEVRSLIHDTKDDTDRCYDDITDMFVNQRLPKEAENLSFPATALFLATHNAASSMKAISAHRQRLLEGLPTTTLECAQLYGMADELSCELLDNHDTCVAESALKREAIPKAFKYLPWGSVSECMGYLHRRAIENRGAVEGAQLMIAALKSELRRRAFGTRLD